MATVVDRYRETARRRRRRAERSNQRFDIQGLRMVAVLAVFAHHLWDWPRGGFVGIDVFFVVSGFLLTGSLLTADTSGRLTSFYANRVRRVLPAAAVVALATYVASVFVRTPPLFGTPDSPLAHYWPLAVGALIVVVWPVLLTAIGWPSPRPS